MWSLFVMSSHCERSPKSVDARNQRYLPLASHAGEIASERPSVTCLAAPVSTFTTSIALYSELRCFAYAIHLPSGDHAGFIVRVGTIHGSLPTTFAWPVATSTTQSLRFVSWNMIRLPSGDHAAV